MNKIRIFVRFDDIDKKTKELESLIGMFINFKIPINLGVIPACVDNYTINFLKKEKNKHPDLIEIDQHGFDHNRIARGEFDVKEELLTSKLENGKKIMTQYFGDNFSGILTIPWHAHSNSLPAVAKRFGFTCISVNYRNDDFGKIYYFMGKILRRNSFLGFHVSYNFQTSHQGILEVSPSIDVMKSYGGAGILKTTDEIFAEFNKIKKTQKNIGFLLHAQYFKTVERVEFLKAIFQELLNNKELAFCKISDLIVTELDRLK